MKAFYQDRAFTVSETVYEPREDTFLLARLVEERAPKGRVLDLGTGCGILGILAAQTADRVVCADLNPDALADAEANAAQHGVHIETVRSDLFENLDDRFDTILFNAPYLPVDDQIEQEEQWARFAAGKDVIAEFLTHAPSHLAERGTIFLVVSSRTGLREVRALAQEHDFSATVAVERKVPWETLFVLELTRAPLPQ